MDFSRVSPEELLRLMEGKESWAIGDKTTVNIDLVVDNVMRKKDRRGACRERNINEGMNVVQFEVRVMWRLEDASSSSGIVDRRNDNRVQAMIKDAGREQIGFSQGVPETFCAVSGRGETKNKPIHEADVAGQNSEDGIAREDIPAPFFKYFDKACGGNFAGKPKGENAADRSAGDQVKPAGERFATILFFKAFEDFGRIESPVAPAGKGQYLEALVGILGGHFPIHTMY